MRKSQGTLELGDEILRSIFASTPDAITVTDLNANIVECNTATLDMHGFSSKDELIGKNAFELIAKKDHERALENLKKTLTQVSVKNIEYTFVAKDGREFPAELSASLVRDASGKPAYFVAITKDISQRRQAEEKVRILATLVNEAKVPIAMVNMDGIVRTWNRSCEEKMGYSAEEIIGKIPMSRICPKAGEQIQTTLREGYCIDKELEYVTKDGRVIPCSTSTFLVKNETGTPVGVAGIAIDLTERKRMEEEIERLAKFPSENPNPVLRLSQDGIVLDANKASEALLRDWGCNVGSVVPKFWRDLATEALASQSSKSVDVEIGEQVYAFFIRPVKEAGYVNLYGRDITDRKRAEEKLKHYSEHLEKLVEERTEEIRLLNESIIQRLVQKIGQIDNIATIKDRLRRTPDVSTGLDLIFDSALNDLGMDVGAVLLIDSKENAARLRGFKSRIEGVKVEESYRLDKGFAEFEVYKDNRNLSKIVRQGEPSALGTASIHCAPILLGREVYGLLAFGSQKALTLDESELAVLSLYAELASSLFEMQSLVVAPVKEVTEGAKRKFELEPGSSYLVKNDVEKAFEVFMDNVLGGFEGLCITRQFPSKVRKKYGLEKTPIVWLTSERAEGETTVHSIQDLSILIANFLDRAKRGVVLLDGLEYLITNHGFEISVRFLQTARSRFEQKDAILVAPLLEKAIDAKEATLIEREMKPLIAQ